MTNYFEVQNSIINKKRISPEDIEKHFNIFQSFNYLKGNIRTAYEANSINILPDLSKIPKVVQYKILRNKITVAKNTFIKFPKKPNKDMETIIEAIARYYNVNNERAKEYFKMMNNSEKTRILKMMSFSGNNYINDPFVLELRTALKNIMSKKR